MGSAAPLALSEPERERVQKAIAAVGRGEIVIVSDDATRENEGDLIMAAETVTADHIAFFLRHTSGVICAALTGERLDTLAIGPMVNDNHEAQETAFTVTVDLAAGVTTGISATDRAATLRALADPATEAGDFVRPGHIFPLRACSDGVLARRGHTEAAVDLARLAGRAPAGILCEVVSEDRLRMADAVELHSLAHRESLVEITVGELARYRWQTERERITQTIPRAESGPVAHLTIEPTPDDVEETARTSIPTAHGRFQVRSFVNHTDGREHLVLVLGNVSGGPPVLTRVHSECLTGDVFGSCRCDCGGQLDDAMRRIATEGRGVIVYLRGHEGRGIGLSQKLAAYALQDRGYDTVEANVHLGLPVDSRDYGASAAILRALGVDEVRLLTNNPAKRAGLTRYGLHVREQVMLPPRIAAENLAYLKAKRDRLGHDLSMTALLPAATSLPAAGTCAEPTPAHCPMPVTVTTPQSEAAILIRFDGSRRAVERLAERWAVAARAGRAVEIRLELGRATTWALAFGSVCAEAQLMRSEIQADLREQAYVRAAELATRRPLPWTLTTRWT
jgi:3,4-dihydroxy 2-butanone 4-phosphate synthase/GTP cyclohydrolase II